MHIKKKASTVCQSYFFSANANIMTREISLLSPTLSCSNPRVPCKSSILPRLNLQLWRDSSRPAPGGHPPARNPPPPIIQHNIGRPDDLSSNDAITSKVSFLKNLFLGFLSYAILV